MEPGAHEMDPVLVDAAPPPVRPHAVTVTKRDWRGRPVYAWAGEVWSRGRGQVVLRAVWAGPGTVDVAAGVRFAPGTVFYEYYDDARPYGLWQVFSPDESRLICWYCNISTPAEFGPGTITFRDLLLDVLVLPDGSRTVLDRDDLVRARTEGLDAALATLAEEATRDVLSLLDNAHPPFADHRLDRLPPRDV